MERLITVLRTNTYAFALVLAIALLIANILVLPAFGDPDTYATTIAGLAPFALVAMASTPQIMSGGGGIDVSIGPMVGLIGVVYVVYLQPHGLGDPELAIPICVLLGAGIGLLNGFNIAVLRYQPVIATLCMYFILIGVSQWILPAAQSTTGGWTDHLTGSLGPIPDGLIIILIPLAVWAFLKRRTSFVKTLQAVGGSDRAALTAGINVTRVRLIAYSLGGAFAAVAAFALIGLTRGADPTIGQQYTLVGIAAVSLGGTVMNGSRGGILGGVFGAACIFLIQNLLSNLGVAPTWFQVAYGGVLVGAVVLSSRFASKPAEALA